MPRIDHVKMLCVGCWLVACGLIHPTGCAAEESPAPAQGEVEIRVVAPDLQPVANMNVVISPRYQHASAPVPVRGTTDAHGRLVFSWREGVHSLNVEVPGVGYGLTGLMDISPKQRAVATLPALAPWGKVRGQLPAELLSPDVRVSLRTLNDQHNVELKLDKDRHFEAEVRADWWRVRTMEKEHPKWESPAPFSVTPGETVIANPQPPIPAAKVAQSLPAPVAPQVKQPVIWAAGTVHDEAGAPVAEATVILVSKVDNYRTEYAVRTARTDDDGRYAIQGEDNDFYKGHITLLVHAPGYCPAMQWINRGLQASRKEAPQAADIVLSKDGGTVEIEVVRDGQPVVGEWICLMRTRDDREAHWTYALNHDAWRLITQLLYPITMTDEHGIATFRHQMPGQYCALAARTEETLNPLSTRFRNFDHSAVAGEALNVTVRNGQVTRHRLQIRTRGTTAPTELALFLPDGQPCSHKNLYAGLRSVDKEQSSMTHLRIGPEAVASIEAKMNRSGLWSFDLRFRDGVKSTSVQDPPYLKATHIFAVSPLLERQPPGVMTARQVRPAAVTVKLQDEAGRPLRGTVQITTSDYFFSYPMMIGSTDAEGVIRFEGLKPFPYHVHAVVPGYMPVRLGVPNTPLPDDALLEQTQLILPCSDKFEIEPDSETTVIVRARRVGYVRGRLKLPAGTQAADYVVSLTRAQRDQGIAVNYDRQTGEFALGPFPAGSAQVEVRDRYDLAEKEIVKFDNVPGQLTRLEIDAPSLEAAGLEPPGPRIPDHKRSWQGDENQHVRGRDLLQGIKVFLSDGQTPAFGAVGYYYPLSEREPISQGLVDASGVLQAYSPPIIRRLDEILKVVGTPGPLIVVLHPGICGAAFIASDLESPQKLVLPAPTRISGKVTVLGDDTQAGFVRVLAACQDRGKLNSLLSIEATADADGRYVLGGLTPGRYLVQAALDDIWLSKSVLVEVKPSSYTDLDLTIGKPGSAVSIQLTDLNGAALKGATLLLERSTGPLADRCWPEKWISDGAGRVFIPTLEAGEHFVRIPADNSRHQFTVRPLQPLDPTDLRIQVQAMR